MVLQLPLKTCQARAAGREHHEGGLQGNRAYASGACGVACTRAGALGAPVRENDIWIA